MDVTVTVKEDDGSIRAFKGYEVKREGRNLDVEKVEQLCAKLEDMPAITHRGIFSTSEFSEGAINKATAHNVELFVLKPWTQPFGTQFPEFANSGRPEDFFQSFESTLLFWINQKLHLIVPSGPPSFTWDGSTPAFTSKGKEHKAFPNMQKFMDAILLRSTQILFPLEPAQTILRTFPTFPLPDNEGFEVGPAWPHTHTLQLKDDKIFLKQGEKLCAVDSVTITGSLQWKRKKLTPQFYVLENVADGKAFAGAIVADWGGDGRMVAFIFPPDSRTLGVHQFQLTAKQMNIIKGLKLRES